MMWKNVVWLTWALFLNEVVSFRTFCPLPSKLKTHYDFNWDSRGNEWVNNDSPTNYLVLTLSWSPSFCSSLSQSAREKEFQCSRGGNSFGLIVHGLWPQKSQAKSIRDHPRNCFNDKQIPAAIIKRFFCLMPDEDLLQAEWEKHGSCYYKTPVEYFTIIEDLYNKLKLPDIRSMENPTSISIKNALLSLNSPQLTSSSVYVTMNKNGNLDEIKICYDLDYKFTNCKQ